MNLNLRMNPLTTDSSKTHKNRLPDA